MSSQGHETGVQSTNDRPRASNSVEDVISQLESVSITSSSASYVEPSPRYYGWFINETDSRSLVEVADNVFADLLKFDKSFQNFVHGFTNLKTDVVASYCPSNFYSKNKTHLHLTAKFCDKKPVPEYKKLVQAMQNPNTKLLVTGLFFSRGTYGFRVHLTPEQEKYFDEREIESGSGELRVQNQNSQGCLACLVDSDYEKAMSDNNHDTDMELKSGVLVKRPLQTNLAHYKYNSRAHLTLGFTSKAAHAGTDLFNMSTAEQSYYPSDYDRVELSSLQIWARVTDVPECESFMVHFDSAVVVDATFGTG